MLTTLPPSVRRAYRRRSPVQWAAIERSRERRSVKQMGGGREIANAVLGPQVTSTPAAAPESKRPKLSTCALCGKRFTSRERGHVVWWKYTLAHESCVSTCLSQLDFSPALIFCELAIRKRLAAELQGRQPC